MIPPFFFLQTKSAQARERERMVREVRQFSEELRRLSAEERAKFWAQVEGREQGKDCEPDTGE